MKILLVCLLLSCYALAATSECTSLMRLPKKSLSNLMTASNNPETRNATECQMIEHVFNHIKTDYIKKYNYLFDVSNINFRSCYNTDVSTVVWLTETECTDKRKVRVVADFIRNTLVYTESLVKLFHYYNGLEYAT